MDAELLQRLCALIATTGDRLVVIDPVTRRPVVLMDLSGYEALIARAQGFSEAASDMRAAGGIDLGALARAAEERAARFTETSPVAPMIGFTPEPLQSSLPDDERFYVEPIE
ncbi:hypothetical protein HY632_00560 [Candidatus Uhrbacteria bacterium]|nr:hypothetical protein [Candidatus Uhrbacteria bacterium]